MTMVLTMVTKMAHDPGMTRQVKASEFKAKCLALMDEVARTGEHIVITKKGRPVAELVPHQRHAQSPFGLWQEDVTITGNIISPIDVEWEAMK